MEGPQEEGVLGWCVAGWCSARGLQAVVEAAKVVEVVSSKTEWQQMMR